MDNRQTIMFLASLFLVFLILGMLYVSNFKNTFEGMTHTKTTDNSGNHHASATASNMAAIGNNALSTH